MPDYSPRNIIDYAEDGNASELRNALYASIHDKVAAHIEAKKQEIAKNLIDTNSEETVDEVPEQLEMETSEEE